MITHSEACESRWRADVMTVDYGRPVHPSPTAWHYTCDEDCVNEMGHTQPVRLNWTGDPLGLYKEVRVLDMPIGRFAGEPPPEFAMWRAEDGIHIEEGPPMPERHAVVVRNLVERTIRLNEDEALTETNVTERTLFFDSKSDAGAFIDSLADPAEMVSTVTDWIENHGQVTHDCADTFPTVRIRDGVGAITIGCPLGQPVLVLPADYGFDKIAALQASLTDVNVLLRAKIDSTIANRLELDEADLASTQGQVTGVGWVGPANDYFDHYEQINAELAQGISKMAKEAIASDKRPPNPSESTVETP